MGNREAKVADVHYEKLEGKDWLGCDQYRATVVLDDGRTGSSTDYSPKMAAQGAEYDAENSK